MPKLSKPKYLALIDLLLIVLSVLLAIYVLPKGKARLVEWGWEGILGCALIWVSVSFLFRKYSVASRYLRYRRIVICNCVIVGMLMGISYLSGSTLMFRDGTYFLLLLITVAELIFFRGMKEVSAATDIMAKADRYFRMRHLRRRPSQAKAVLSDSSEAVTTDAYATLKAERGTDVADYLASIENFAVPHLCVLPTVETSVMEGFEDGTLDSIIMVRRLNNVAHLNTLFSLVNAKLSPEGHLLCCLKLKNTRKQRILAQYPKGINWGVYTADYFFRRLLPKLRITKWLYFKLTRGYNRILTYTEVLGHLYASGFELMEKKQFGELHYLQLRKVADPDRDIKTHYGLLIKLARVGKRGKMINVYKMRSMHPYAEYIQAYLYNMNGSKTGDKFENDFRVNATGHFFRRFWIDELPMFINLFKGELKIVGVRPLSRHKYSTYPKALQKKRILTKPGLVPPYYADMPKKEEELWASEDRYLDAYLKQPWRTDWRYFWKAFYNIVFRGERSS